MKTVAETLGVARSNLIDRLQGKAKPRRRYRKAQDAALVPLITALEGEDLGRMIAVLPMPSRLNASESV